VESESSGEFNLLAAADELIASEANTEATQESSTEGQSEKTPDESVNEKELSAEEILKQVAEEKPEEASQELIEKINALGAIHNGLPITVNSPEQLKELLQKGFDYTKKTMEHAELARSKAEEFSKLDVQYKEKEAVLVQKEQEIQNTVFENNIMEGMLLKWKKQDPELFDYVSQAYQQEVGQHEANKPLISQYENRFKEYDNRFAQMENGKQQAELSNIKKSWESDLNDVQTKQAAPLMKLGVKADWEKVKAAWSADSTGKMSVEEALYAVHGKDIALANQSYQKLLASKNKAQASKLGRGGVNGSQRSGETIKAQGMGDYDSILKQAFNQL